MRKLWRLVGSAFLPLWAAAAYGDTINLNYSTSLNGYSVSGVITATSYGAAGEYRATGITGSGSGMTVTGLEGIGQFAGNDNLLFTTGGPVLDSSGLALLLTSPSFGSTLVKIYGSALSSSGYAEFYQGAGGIGTAPLTFFRVSATPATAATPEPTSLLLLGTAAAVLTTASVLRRRSRKSAERVVAAA